MTLIIGITFQIQITFLIQIIFLIRIINKKGDLTILILMILDRINKKIMNLISNSFNRMIIKKMFKILNKIIKSKNKNLIYLIYDIIIYKL